MYNGIGLQTARGSGTNGYAQSNTFFVKPRPRSTTSGGGPGRPHRPLPPDAAGADGGGMRKPNKEILEHDRKRQVELKLLVLRDALEEHGYTEDEIEERVAEARKAAEAEAAAAVAAEEAGSGRGAGRPPLPVRGLDLSWPRRR
uniref:CWF21 domain-containing protein n=1 Tax=Zea mays TaxID=4577 RepID=A0A804P2W0_MAIZE